MAVNQFNPEHTKMPVIFIGHGSPMNAIETNEFTLSLSSLAKTIPQPRAIVCISAHWLTEGTWVTHMSHPKTIHDFYGFPQALFDIQYPAPGCPQIADLIMSTVNKPHVHADDEIWGIDHGTWSVMRHLYPDASIPTIQLSIYLEQPASYHYHVGQQLQFLRDHGVLIVGSGNIVHNLPRIVWGDRPKPFDWAIEFDEWAKDKLLTRDDQALITQYANFEAGQLSVPIPDHYFPLLYVLGAASPEDDLSFTYEGIQNGSISMRTLKFG